MNEQRSERRTNMRDVARNAGVSLATVSRVLSGASKFAEATRTKVQTSLEVL